MTKRLLSLRIERRNRRVHNLVQFDVMRRHRNRIAAIKRKVRSEEKHAEREKLRAQWLAGREPGVHHYASIQNGLVTMRSYSDHS